MSHEAAQFLASDLLEKYLLGTTTFEETQKAEHFIEAYPEVKAQYMELQENLEAYATSFAVKAPETVRENVMSAIAKNKPRKSRRYFAAAGIAAFIFALGTFYFWDRSNTLTEQNAVIRNEIKLLKENINAAETELNAIRDQFVLISDPGLKKYTLTGNEKAKEFKALAYVNPEKKAAYINVINLPGLPENKCYQMWADINGEMVSLAVLKNTDGKLAAIPYKENAVSYNITIEPKGGNDHATVANLVANVFL